MKKSIIYLLIGVFLVSSCKITHRYDAPALGETTEKQLFRDAPNADTTSLGTIPWNQFFQDELLLSYIEEGIRSNPNYLVALQNIAISQAAFKQSKQAYLPSIFADPTVTFSKQSKAAINLPPTVNINLRTTTVQLPIGASWELDIWGKISSAKRAALANYMGTQAAAQATKTQLVAAIAGHYFQLMALDEQLKITEQTIELRKQDVEALKLMQEASMLNGAALALNEANLHAAEVSLPEIKQRIRETENALSILLGRVPGPIVRNTLQEQQLSPVIAIGIPLHLIKNRPDVAACEFEFQRAFEATNVARTNFYPALSLNGRAGLSALTTNSLGVNAFFGTLVANLMQPIYNKGINTANLKRAKAQQEQALLSFQDAVLRAGAEVSDALYAHQNIEERREIRKQQVQALQRAVEYTKELLKYDSKTNYTDVITAEQALLQAQLSEINDQFQQHLALIELYRSLGGGWK